MLSAPRIVSTWSNPGLDTHSGSGLADPAIESARTTLPGVRCMLGSESFWGDFSVGIFKILLLLAIGFVVWRLIRAYQRSLNSPPSPANTKAVETMVKCAHCAVNLPRSEAIYTGGEFYCTPEHQKLGKS